MKGRSLTNIVQWQGVVFGERQAGRESRDDEDDMGEGEHSWRGTPVYVKFS